jgi:hypothetical protein
MYDPQFVPASQTGYGDDELVRGVAIPAYRRAWSDFYPHSLWYNGG